ncbi:LPS-assembly protein LptD [bacterium]|nr:LPS-assembly protein LptD [bacterium]
MPGLLDGRSNVGHGSPSFPTTLPAHAAIVNWPQSTLRAAAFLAALLSLGPSASASVGELVHLRSAGNIDVSLLEGRRQVTFTDSVVFDYAGYHMKAGRLTLDEVVGRAWAEGGLSLAGPGGSAVASEAWMDLNRDRIVLRNIDVRAGPWSASAAEATVEGERMDLIETRMTVCPTPNPLYSLRARRLSRETPFRYVARGVVPYFYAIPFFYLPKYSYELEKSAEGTLVASRQGPAFEPGRGNFTGIFFKTFWRKKFLDRRLLSTSHFDYYTRPGPALGQELEYRSRSSEHYTFAYFTRQRVINHDNFSRPGGRVNRWRLWQTWTRKFSNGHFKSFVNETSDSVMEDDYRLYFDDRRPPEREVNVEFVYDRPQVRFKLLGERIRSLNIGGPREYRLDRKRMPAVRALTFPALLSRPPAPTARLYGSRRLYGFADVTAGRGRDRPDRADGEFGEAKLSGLFAVSLAEKLSMTTEAGVQTDYYQKKITGQTRANTHIGGGRMTVHRPFWGERLQADAGYAFRKAITNESLYAADDGQVENQLFLSLRQFRPWWRASLDGGYDFRKSRRDMATLDLLGRVGGSARWLSSVARYDPTHNRLQSVYTSGAFKWGTAVRAGIGYQIVNTDTENQRQFSPYLEFTPPVWPYRLSFTGLYDADQNRLRTLRAALTRMFNCIETTFTVTKADRDIQFNFSFRVTGFEKGESLFNQPRLESGR